MTVTFRQNLSTNVRNKKMKVMMMSTLFSLAHRFAPQMVENFVHERFFRPRLFVPDSDQLAFIKSAEQFQLQVNEKTVQCCRMGGSRFVLFVHGWNGSGVQFHPWFKPFLSAGFGLITIDAPGHGRSDGRTSSFFEYIQTLKTLFNSKYGKEIIAAVGHSFGAAAIANNLGRGVMDCPAVLLAPAIDIQGILNSTFNQVGIPPKMAQSIITDYEIRFKMKLSEENPQELIDKIKTPVLLVHAPNDTVTPYQASQGWSEKYKNIQFQNGSDLGHRRILSAPEVIRASLAYIKQETKD